MQADYSSYRGHVPESGATPPQEQPEYIYSGSRPSPNMPGRIGSSDTAKTAGRTTSTTPGAVARSESWAKASPSLGQATVKIRGAVSTTRSILAPAPKPLRQSVGDSFESSSEDIGTKYKNLVATLKNLESEAQGATAPPSSPVGERKLPPPPKMERLFAAAKNGMADVQAALKEGNFTKAELILARTTFLRNGQPEVAAIIHDAIPQPQASPPPSPRQSAVEARSSTSLSQEPPSPMATRHRSGLEALLLSCLQSGDEEGATKLLSSLSKEELEAAYKQAKNPGIALLIQDSIQNAKPHAELSSAPSSRPSSAVQPRSANMAEVKSAVRNEVNRQIADLKGENKVLGREGPLTGISLVHNKAKNTFVATLTFTTSLGTKKTETLELDAKNLPNASEIDIIPVLHEQVNNMPVIRPTNTNLQFLEGKYTSKQSDTTEVLLVGGARRCTAKQQELFEKHAVSLLREGNRAIRSEVGVKKFEKLKEEQQALTKKKNEFYEAKNEGAWRGSADQARLLEINEELGDVTQYDIPGKIAEGLAANQRAADATVESHIGALNVIGSLKGLKLKSGQSLSELCQKTAKQIQDANTKFIEFKKSITPEELLTLLIADKSSKDWTDGAFKIEGADFAQLFEGPQNAVTGIATPFITSIYKVIQSDIDGNEILTKLTWQKFGGGVLNDSDIAKNRQVFQEYAETCNPKLTSEQVDSLCQKHTQMVAEYSTRSEKVMEFAKAIADFYSEFSALPPSTSGPKKPAPPVAAEQRSAAPMEAVTAQQPTAAPMGAVTPPTTGGAPRRPPPPPPSAKPAAVEAASTAQASSHVYDVRTLKFILGALKLNDDERYYNLRNADDYLDSSGLMSKIFEREKEFMHTARPLHDAVSALRKEGVITDAHIAEIENRLNE